MHPRPPIDLHAHTTVSDGTATPTGLVAAALTAGLGTVAITDHDSTAGWAEAAASAGGTPLTVIPGIELSTQVDGVNIHVLGYFVDPLNPDLVEATAAIRASRTDRSVRIVEAIGRDFPLVWDDVLARTTPETTIGRPHIADALVAKEIATDREDAFTRILSSRNYTVPLQAPSPADGVAIIVEAGGVPVLAHPATPGPSTLFDAATIGRLASLGLAGLELHHPDSSLDLLPRWESWAARFDFIVTGSSDWHGTGRLDRLGVCTTAPAQFDRIVRLAGRRRSRG